MINRLVIHRFRGIRQGVLEDLGKVNLLIGPNNSGKSAILEMLYLGGTSGREVSLILEGVPAEESVFQATTSVKQDFLGHFPLPRLRQRHGLKPTLEDNPVVISEEGGFEVDLKTLISGSPIPLFRFGAPLEAWGAKQSLKFFNTDIKRIALFSVNQQKNMPAALIPPFFRQNAHSEETRWHFVWDPDWVYRWDQTNSIDHFAVWADAGKNPDSNRVLLFDFHTANDHFTKTFAKWAYQKIVGWEPRIAQVMGRVFPELKESRVNIKPASDDKSWTGYIEWPDREVIEIDQFGDGARHAFKLLASLVAMIDMVDDEHPGLFLWEEPELFMHPESLGRLLSEVLELIRDKAIQIILSSQSLEVVALMTRYFEKTTPEVQDTFRAFRLELDGGRLYAATFHLENLRTWLEQGMDPRFWGVANLPFSYRYHDKEEHLAEEES